MSRPPGAALPAWPAHVLGLALAASAVVLRIQSLPRVHPDMEEFLRYYQHLNAGGLAAFGDNFSVYPPPYLYLLGVATTSHAWLEPVTAIKMISMAFDLAAAAIAYLIIRLYVADVRRARVGALLVLLIPTVWLNSAAWGQSDVIYTTFLLGCVYFVLRGWPPWSMISFGLAFSVKLQAVFLLPFVAFEWWRRSYRKSVLLVPVAIYVAVGFPVVLFGRSFVDLLKIYPRQAQIFTDLSISAPSLWAVCFLTADRCRGGAGWLGVGVTLMSVILTVAAVLVFCRRRWRDAFASTMLAATGSALLVPLVLPRMHERYFFPADVLSFLLAVCIPRLWYLAVGVQVASWLSYATYLWGWSALALVSGAALNTACLVALLVEAARAEPGAERSRPLAEPV